MGCSNYIDGVAMRITTVETANGVHWVSCRTHGEKVAHENRNRGRAIAELVRLGRPPQPGDQRSARELWDDAKGREPQQGQQGQGVGRAR